MRVKYEVMLNEFQRVLEKYGFNRQDAHEAAEIFARTLWQESIPTASTASRGSSTT